MRRRLRVLQPGCRRSAFEWPRFLPRHATELGVVPWDVPVCACWQVWTYVPGPYARAHEAADVPATYARKPHTQAGAYTQPHTAARRRKRCVV